MPQLYALRRFSSWSFRLSASVALLLSSAGLAASMLVSTTMPARTSPLAWRPTVASAHAASELAAAPVATAQALPVSLSSMVPTYALVASVPAPAPASYAAPERTANAAEVASPYMTSTLKATAQRSWRTFKLAFR